MAKKLGTLLDLIKGRFNDIRVVLDHIRLYYSVPNVKACEHISHKLESH